MVMVLGVVQSAVTLKRWPLLVACRTLALLN
jgi:hypothetical protein